MPFSSGGFGIFLALSVAAVRLTPTRWRWISLLLLSLVFYGFFCAPELFMVLVAVTLVAWSSGRLVERSDDGRVRARWLLLGVGTIVGVLAATRLAGPSAPAWTPSSLRLGSAIGVSYYTIQAVSYVVDVQTGRCAAERNPWRLLGYLAFFPKLVQGPIERAPALLPQLAAPPSPAYDCLRSGVALFGLGLFKKVVLADRLAPVVDAVYGAPQCYAGFVPVLATYAYAFQLYFDFSGYTDMARGSARLLGIELSENFNVPYLATSVSDFWRRWHMSFSRWLLDYLFTPLQLVLRRHRSWGTAVALFSTFGLCGLWHGASWTFLAWGVLHGTYLATEALWRGWRGHRPAPDPWSRALGILCTFHLVALSWVFFRSPTLSAAEMLLTSMLRPTVGLDVLFSVIAPQSVAVTLGVYLVYASALALSRCRSWKRLAANGGLRWGAYFVFVLLILLLRQDTGSYLYAQF